MRTRILILVLSGLLAGMCAAQTRVELSTQVKGVLPPANGGFIPNLDLSGSGAAQNVVGLHFGTSRFSLSGSTPPSFALPCVGYISTGTIGGTACPGGGSLPYDFRVWTRALGLQCDGSTNVSAAASAILTAIGAQNATILFIKDGANTGPCVIGSITFPPNVTLDFSGGGSIQAVVNPATPGHGANVQSSCTGFTTTLSASNSLPSPPTAGNAILNAVMYEFGSGTIPQTPTDTANDAAILLQQSNLNFQSNSALWGAANVAGGVNSQTWTLPFSGSAVHGVFCSYEVAGEGTGLAVDPASTFGYVGGSSPYSGPYSVTSSGALLAGDFLLGFGGQGTNNITASSPTLTQPSGSGGNTNGYAAQYQNVSSAGSLTISQTISSTTTDYWVYSLVGIYPGSSTMRVCGGLYDPDKHQIFYNATGNNGLIDFTCNFSIDTIVPEWWGASGSASAAANTPAIQASVHGAFGTNRVNGSGLGVYNKKLFLGTNYNINGAVNLWDTNGFVIECANRLNAGLTQTQANAPIINGQSNTYGRISDCGFNSAATDTNPTASVIFDWNGTSTATDLKPQFISLYDDTFTGAGLRDVGVIIAPSGGAAQGSNFLFSNNSFAGFTGAGLQVGGNGQGRNAGRSIATNALSVSILNGDMQNCPLYGIANYGGGFITVDNMSFECTSPWASYLTALGTAVDIHSEEAQGPVFTAGMRSEDLRLIEATYLVMKWTSNINQGYYWYSLAGAKLAGTTLPVNSLFQGSDIGSDGALYKISAVTAPFAGTGLTQASSGSSTSVTDANQNVSGSVTSNAVFISGETVTQTSTGSSATLLNAVASTRTFTGSVTSGAFASGETMTQTSSGATGVLLGAPIGSGNMTITSPYTGTANSSNTWTGGTTGAVYTPTSAPVPNATIMLISPPSGSPNGTNTWVGGTSAAVFTPTGSPTGVGWTSNQFVGAAGAQMQVTFWNGTNKGAICGPITSNTSTVINYTSCTTNYSAVQIVTPDNTSQFVVEPYWSSTPTSNGGVTFAKTNYAIIQGAPLNVAGQCDLERVVASGGLVNCISASRIDSLSVSRPDWLPTGVGSFSNGILTPQWHNIQVTRPYSSSLCGSCAPVWSLAGRNGPSTVFSGVTAFYDGTVPHVFSIGMDGGGLSANDVWIGGRSDQNAQTDVTRNRLEIQGMLGPASPFGTNQNGSNLLLGGGLSTGSGTPGSIQFYLGAPGSSGTQVNGGGSSPSYAMTLSSTGLTIPLTLPTTTYSAAGTALPTCVSGLKGAQAVVSDATTPTYMVAYTSGGAVTAAVICNGSSWLTH